MKTWHKVLIGIFGAAVSVLPLFVKNAASKEKLEKIEEAAGTAIGEAISQRN
jgi:hypothetical protein